MRPSVRHVALLLFVSGACALVFQTAWFREFRLIFGASTPASAAVLAIFMGGLGLGNALLGKRADATANPLRLYALLELSISLACAATPLLVGLIRSVYIASGGQETLGLAGATLARLVGAALVLGLPTFLMGGTLPAAARAVTSEDDVSRGDVGWLYGLNTLGAVLGAVLGTFFLLERFGTQATLWIACGANLLNSLAAWRLSLGATPLQTIEPAPSQRRKLVKQTTEQRPRANEVVAEPPPTLPAAAYYFAAGLVGFAFFLMELVWYRMLGPILGGSTFTFGLILAVALAGIGIGGAIYPLVFRNRSPDLRSFILTLGWEALAIALPYALGDRLAVLSAMMRSLAAYGFLGQAAGWLVITMIVVFPAALVSGIQFPLLIGLIGRGNRDVGKQLGQAFGWNTVGAMAGSLAGGFGLLGLLSATGVWQAVVVLLGVLAIVLLVLDYRRERRAVRLLQPLGVLVLAAICLGAVGPTAVWRHSGIGAGRSPLPPPTRTDLRAWMNSTRRHIIWQADGRESAVAISAQSGAAFLVNGKSDGNAISDVGTQVMLGALGVLLHPDPQDGLVIGLGTGESAGWMAHMPAIQRVDVIELEPMVTQMAHVCTPLNHNVLAHPKVRLVFNDAREQLQTTRRTYDLIASEPSNPYRTGVSSLYTREFYESARQRLKPGGLFLQWLQAYEIDAATARIVLATLCSVFPHIEIWQTQIGDLVLVCSPEPLAYTPAELASRLAEPAMRQAVRLAWQTTSVEGVLSHVVAGERYAAAVARLPAVPINRDDRNVLEYAFARTVGREGALITDVLYAEASHAGWNRPSHLEGQVNWQAVAEHRQMRRAAEVRVAQSQQPGGQLAPGDAGHRQSAMMAVTGGDFAGAVRHWDLQAVPPREHLELLLMALARAEIGDSQAEKLIEQVRAASPLEAGALDAVFAARQNRPDDAVQHLVNLFTTLRTDPTATEMVVERTLRLATELGAKNSQHAAALYTALSRNFGVFLLEQRRVEALCAVARNVAPPQLAAAIALLEPYPPWNAAMLELRVVTYEQTSDPRLARARRDLIEFRRSAPDAAILGRK